MSCVSQLRYFDQTTNCMNIIGRLIENPAVMFVIICVDFTQDFMAVQSAVADTRKSIRN